MHKIAADSLVFDLDGTLWDASGTCALAWNLSLREAGITEVQVDASRVRSYSGLKMDVILAQHFGFLDASRQALLLERYRHNEATLMREQGGILFPGTRGVLRSLASRYPLFIVSNCLAGYIENFLAFHGLQDLFVDWECSGNTGLSKGENIQLVRQRHALARPVYIGDTRWDMEASQAAGIPFIFAAYGFGDPGSVAWRIENLAELPGLLDGNGLGVTPR
ncbi:MAG TPA: HAD family hydrolase [Chitinophagaceae bacterium]|nr:HAD family hydrolase [Chitinophagaceae bacterium]